jgi:glycosyltransferase involved in cell wall biosynthesis
MNDRPLVSVVIIFWNAERFLEEAIDSVFAQTYTNWELLLVDDGSNDGSTAIARRYGVNDSRVRYMEHLGHSNRGKSVSRNLGIHCARGKYIALLDADDVWLPDILKEQIAILESHPETAMVYGPIQWWYSWTGSPEDLRRDYIEDLGVTPHTMIQPPSLLMLFLQNRAAVPSDILVRREIIERVGGFEENFKVLYEDQVFYAKICLAAPVIASDRCWYRYRQHPDSSCARAKVTGEYYTSRRVFLSWLGSYVSEQGVKDTGLWQALNEELWPYRHPVAYRLLRRLLTNNAFIKPISRFEEALRRMQHPFRQMRNKNSYSRVQSENGERR